MLGAVYANVVEPELEEWGNRCSWSRGVSSQDKRGSIVGET